MENNFSKLKNAHHLAAWDETYTKNDLAQLGWYEKNPQPSFSLIENSGIDRNAHILDVGAGASTLTGVLLKAGFRNLSLLDFSSAALDKLKSQLDTRMIKNIKWLVDDITNPHALDNIPAVTLWHDRAVLHFLVDEKDRNIYREHVKNKIVAKGYFICSAFSNNNPQKCSGFPVRPYEISDFEKFLGGNFQLIEGFQYEFKRPQGDVREFTVAVMQKR